MGSAFGAQEFGVTPDMMTMAKATTNGISPMGVVACKDEIYDTLWMVHQKEQLNYFMDIHIQESQFQLQLH